MHLALIVCLFNRLFSLAHLGSINLHQSTAAMAHTQLLDSFVLMAKFDRLPIHLLLYLTFA